ncbi:MAG: CoA-binding protein [Chitinophagales bacterium]|nr:CoA-binding protein [Chitinophagales bacterium]MDW8273641.1 CoA-binding protein [Chitinophagales bacterium]
MKNKPTLVLGASTDPQRYSYKAILLLRKYGHNVIAVGKQLGQVGDVTIDISFPDNISVHTVTLYLNPLNQRKYIDQILQLRPQRIIFNPGTENPEFEQLAKENNIQTEQACTLVLLNTGQY